MELLSLTGVAVGIAILVLGCYKGVQMFLTAVLASIVIIVFSGMPVLEVLNGIWADSLGSFVAEYALVFVGGCLYGQTMADGKGSRSLAVAFANLIRKSKKNQKFICVLFVPVMYMILNYVGVNGFVIVFTILYTARDLYQEIDVPWRFYCYGGAASIAVSFLGGSLYICNLQLAELCGTPLTAAMGLSIVGFAVYCLVFLILAWLDIRKAERRGETFMDTGAPLANRELEKQNGMPEPLPKTRYALISMASVIFCAAAFHVLLGLLAGIFLNFLFFRKYMPQAKKTVTDGITQSFSPILNTAATVGLSSVVAASSGFQMITEALSILPPLYFGPTVIAVVTFITSAQSGAVEAFAPQAIASMRAAGYSAPVIHRILSVAGFTSAGPNSPGVVNSTMLTKLPYKQAVPIYLKMSMLPGIAAMIIMSLCVQCGLFH